jgi:hypothetical protein
MLVFDRILTSDDGHSEKKTESLLPCLWNKSELSLLSTSILLHQ